MSYILGDSIDDDFELSRVPKSFTIDDDFGPDMSVLPTAMRIQAGENTLIKEVFVASKASKPRSRYDVLASLMEEVGELATEVAIAEGHSSKPKGDDGIIGEAVDVVLCAIDLIYVDWKNANIPDLEKYIMTIVKNKVNKWKTKQQS